MPRVSVMSMVAVSLTTVSSSALVTMWPMLSSPVSVITAELELSILVLLMLAPLTSPSSSVLPDIRKYLAYITDKNIYGAHKQNYSRSLNVKVGKKIAKRQNLENQMHLNVLYVTDK